MVINIFKKLEQQDQLLQKILLLLLQLIEQQKPAHTEEWLDGTDLKKRLNIGDSTLYRMRKKQVLTARRISGKWFYKMPFFEATTPGTPNPELEKNT